MMKESHYFIVLELPFLLLNLKLFIFMGLLINLFIIIIMIVFILHLN